MTSFNSWIYFAIRKNLCKNDKATFNQWPCVTFYLDFFTLSQIITKLWDICAFQFTKGMCNKSYFDLVTLNLALAQTRLMMINSLVPELFCYKELPFNWLLIDRETKIHLSLSQYVAIHVQPIWVPHGFKHWLKSRLSHVNSGDIYISYHVYSTVKWLCCRQGDILPETQPVPAPNISVPITEICQHEILIRIWTQSLQYPYIYTIYIGLYF